MSHKTIYHFCVYKDFFEIFFKNFIILLFFFFFEIFIDSYIKKKKKRDLRVTMSTAENFILPNW